MAAAPAPRRRRPFPTLARGFQFKWATVLLLAAINTGVAAVLWVEDTRPFWQPWPIVSCTDSRSSIA
jgi:hypothetical protein